MQPLDSTGPDVGTTVQASRGKPIPKTDFRYTTAGFTLPALGGYGLRHLTPTRPTLAPTYPVPVRRLVPLLHASFRPHLAMTPLRFTTLHLHPVGRGTSTLQDSQPCRLFRYPSPYFALDLRQLIVPRPSRSLAQSNNIASSLPLRCPFPRALDAMIGCLLCFPSGALRARRVSSAASRLPGTTSLRFALPGGQRVLI